jgi:hypothetical protein
VITTSFSGTSRDGHGQHQASGTLAKEAFTAAADPARFPEQLRYVEPWQAKRLVYHTFSGTRPEDAIQMDGGEFNPILGRSYGEIAGLSRSLHKSQGMGAGQPRGSAPRYFVTEAGEPARKDVFDGIDTTWNRLPGGAAPGRLLADALAAFAPEHPEKTIPLLLKARPLIAAIRDPWAARKLEELDEAVALCAGLWLDTQAATYEAVPGSSVSVQLTALNRSAFPLTLVSSGLEGMGERPAGDTPAAALPYNQAVTRQQTCAVPADQPYSQPYWLVQPRRGDYYDVRDQQLIGLPENPPVLRARFRIEAGGQTLELFRPVRYRYVDHLLGERTRPLVVAPPVTVDVPESVMLFPDGGSRKVQVEIGTVLPQAIGTVKLELEAGWKAAEASRTFQVARGGEQQTVAFDVTPPAGPLTSGARLVAEVEGRPVPVGMRVIDYPHFPPQTWFPPAAIQLVRGDVRVAARKVGYIMGAGDEMPDALRQLGCEVVPLAASDLEQHDLAAFDAIVTGVRAYNVRADLRANQPRLLEYVRNGGTLVVQYNVLDGTLKDVNLGPYPFTIGRERVTVEDAPVAFPDPSSPLLQAPNAITADDFKGWVQERGLYFASKWDPRYHTVLECDDPGEAKLAGGELWTRYGKGIYIFTAYSWFRQLPAGVPGAYRLFANLLSAM